MPLTQRVGETTQAPRELAKKELTQRELAQVELVQRELLSRARARRVERRRQVAVGVEAFKIMVQIWHYD